MKRVAHDKSLVVRGKFKVTRTSYDSLVGELLKQPFPTIWKKEDFLRELGITEKQFPRFGVALRLAGVEYRLLWRTDPVTKKRIQLTRIYRLLRSELPEHLRVPRNLDKEHHRQWRYVRAHVESAERLQRMIVVARIASEASAER